MLSEKHAKIWIRILALLIVAAFSFLFLAGWATDSKYAQYSMEQVEKNNKTVMAFEAAALSASLAISMLPDDFGSSYAEAFTELNAFFVLILVMLVVEKLLLVFGFKFAFCVAVPVACLLLIFAHLTKRDGFKVFAVRLCVLGLAVSLAVPGSTYIADVVSADLDAYVEQTIAETNEGAEKLNTAAAGESNGDFFENVSVLFSNAIQGVKELMQYFRNMITKCMYAIAIMLIKTAVMPIITFFFLRWALNETVHILTPVQQVRIVDDRNDEEDGDDEEESMVERARELLGIGE